MSAREFTRLTAALIAALCVVSSADAAIEKIAQPTDTGVQFHWWPHLPPLRGWHRDEEATQHYGFNALAPNGTTFADAASVIYARALYKPRVTDRSVADVIASDWRTMVGNTPSIHRTKMADVRDADGKVFAVYSFTQTASGNFETAAYGEEGDYFLLLVMSSRTKAAFVRDLPSFTELLRHYAEKLPK